ncbi:hypothetical protein ACFPRL_22670 [Pseudoclavibacter helvolus]
MRSSRGTCGPASRRVGRAASTASCRSRPERRTAEVREMRARPQRRGGRPADVKKPLCVEAAQGFQWLRRASIP